MKKRRKLVKIRQLSFELIVQDYYHYQPVFNGNFLYFMIWLIDHILYSYLNVSDIQEIDSDENIELEATEDEIPRYLYSSCLPSIVKETTITEPMTQRVFLNKEMDITRLSTWIIEINNFLSLNPLPNITPFVQDSTENETQKNIITFVLNISLVKPFITIPFNAEILRESATEISRSISNTNDSKNELRSDQIEKCCGFITSEILKLKSASS